ncbi:putative oxidoreductase [Baekduia alba]|uniref:SDR family oxidoreductase n=1 Tax=Baekduia alba TaxID=2997333 RepID=UPI00234006AC|nr:SDR family oxidoreductase [Baekduia alba]WCB92346.1 putative oxidoreductase [Baekduia alba]
MSSTEAFSTTRADDKPLTGRVAVVTGATSGIGAATAQSLVAAGAAVAVVGRRAERLDELAVLLDDDGVVPVAADVSDPDALTGVAEVVRAKLGRVDLVVANAGQMLGAPWEDADVAEWDRMIDVNVRGLLRTGRVFADDLLAAAAEGLPADLVHVGSVGGHLTFPNYGVYAATKAAVAHLTRNLRAELGPRGVRVKAVEPGLVATELGDDMAHDTGREMLAGLHAQIAALEPGDIADAIAYAVAAPPRVNIAELIVVPTAQG